MSDPQFIEYEGPEVEYILPNHRSLWLAVTGPDGAVYESGNICGDCMQPWPCPDAPKEA